MKLQHLLFGLSMTALAVSQSHAQTVTSITPDSGVGFDTGTVVTPGGGVNLISGGELSGGNLFHSFSQFDLAQSDIATWTTNAPNSASVFNVINRVRGGPASHIDGTINSTNLANANFYFINPAGVVFGSSARINVPNSVYFSTAQELRFAGGVAFSTVTPDGSTFSSAPPEAFGFLGAQQDIAFRDGYAGPAGPNQPTALSFAAGDISIQGDVTVHGSDTALIAVGDGTAQLVLANPLAVTGNGTVDLQPNALLVGDALSLAGSNIALDNANIRFSGPGDGKIALFGGNISLKNGSNIQHVNPMTAGGSIAISGDRLELAEASTVFASVDLSTTIDAASVDIKVQELQVVDGQISSSTQSGGNAGDVNITANSVSLSGDSTINSATFLTSSTGNAGTVIVNTANALAVADNAVIEASTAGAGNAGNVLITANNATLTGKGAINSQALQGATGTAGNVLVKIAKTLSLADAAQISAATASPGNAGFVDVIADVLRMNGGAINSFANSSGDAGLVSVSVNRLEMFGGRIDSSSESELPNAGRAGNVIVTAKSAALNGPASIDSEGVAGDAGNVLMMIVDELSLATNALNQSPIISASTFGAGNAGIVDVTADRLNISGGTISSTTTGSGNAGFVAIGARQLAMTGGSITSLTTASGDAGDVLVTADNAVLSGDASINSVARAPASGAAGRVLITIAENLTLADDGVNISASTAGPGDAGLILISADNLEMTGGAITSFTAGAGNAGSVGVVVNQLNLSRGRIDSSTDSAFADAGDAGDVAIAANSALITGNSSIDSQGFIGNAGNVSLLVVNDLILDNDSIGTPPTIAASALGPGNAGTVRVEADQLTMRAGTISSSTRAFASGNAGDVNVKATDLFLSGRASINSRALLDSSGNAGTVSVDVINLLSLAENASISASTLGNGDAGSVRVSSSLLEMKGGEISSSTGRGGNATPARITSQNIRNAAVAPTTGNAGNVVIGAGSAMLSGGASISSQALSGSNGDAGSVLIAIADTLFVNSGSFISTSTAGTGQAGNITIGATTLQLNNGFIRSISATDVAAGAIGIAGDTIRILDGSRISTNSANGPAGDIGIFLPDDGFLFLSGVAPGVITTSSGSNTGGFITISDPFLILANGGNILALGEQGGANVLIQSQFFIRSADRLNLLSVNGSLVLDSQIGDQITGTEAVEIPFLDASGILSGRCAGTRTSGRTSRFIRQITGPYSPVIVEGDLENEAGDSIPIAALPTLEPCS